MLDVTTPGPFLDDHHRTLGAELDRFVASDLAPLQAPDTDADARHQARDCLERIGHAGLLRFLEPLDLRAACLCREAIAAASPLADEVFALQCLGTMPMLLGGSSNTERWLGPVVRGEAMAAFAMTEPDAGSDVAAMTTTARRDGDDYVLSGAKTLISNAGIADFYTVFAKTDAAAGHRGISCFVVPAEAPGLVFAGPIVLSAPHPLGDLRFEECRVPASALVGAEGAGFKLGMATLDALRTTVAAAACGMATRALDEALAHAVHRRQFGGALSELQLVQAKLARMATDLSASRLLVYRAAYEKDRGAERVSMSSAMAKVFATEAAQRIVDDAVQILGGRGVVASHPVDRLYRAIRPLRIYEGATDIQHVVIARALLRARIPTKG